MIFLKKIFSKIKLNHLILFVFGVLYCAISLVNHYNFRTYALDLGLYNNAIYSYSHFQINHYSLLRELFPNMLGDHFELIPFFVSPLYWIFGSYTMLLVQIAVILFGGYGIYKIFIFRTNNSLFSSIAMFHFFSIWGIWSALSFDFHCNVIAAMLVPWFIYYFEKSNVKKAALVFVLILISKENMALWAVFICAGLALINFKNKQNLIRAIIFAGVALVYFVCVMKIFMPLFNNGAAIGYYHFKYKALGADGSEAVKTIFTKPLYALKLLYTSHLLKDGYTLEIKKELIYMFFISGGVFFIFKPQYLVMLIPIFAQKLYSDDFGKWGINNQYSVELVPILTLCSFQVLYKNKYWHSILAFALALVTLHATYSKLQTRYSVWYREDESNIFKIQHYHCNINRKSLYEAMDKIPENAKVAACAPAIPHISNRKYIFRIPDYYYADCILLVDEVSFYYPLWPQDIKSKINELLVSPNWKCDYNKDGVYLFIKTK